MRIVLKPLGAATVFAAIIALAIVAFRNLLAGDSVSGNAFVVSSVIDPMGKNPSAKGGVLTVYRDGLENGWQDRGWAKVIDYADIYLAHGSTGKSIRVEAGPYEAVKIYHPEALDLSSFRHFVCYINGGEKGGQHLVLSAIAGGKNRGKVQFPPLPPNQWVRLSVPFTKLDVEGRSDFNSFWIQSMSGDAAPAFYVDDVELRKGEPETEPGQTLPFTRLQSAGASVL